MPDLRYGFDALRNIEIYSDIWFFNREEGYVDKSHKGTPKFNYFRKSMVSYFLTLKTANKLKYLQEHYTIDLVSSRAIAFKNIRVGNHYEEAQLYMRFQTLSFPIKDKIIKRRLEQYPEEKSKPKTLRTLNNQNINTGIRYHVTQCLPLLAVNSNNAIFDAGNVTYRFFFNPYIFIRTLIRTKTLDYVCRYIAAFKSSMFYEGFSHAMDFLLEADRIEDAKQQIENCLNNDIKRVTLVKNLKYPKKINFTTRKKITHFFELKKSLKVILLILSDRKSNFDEPKQLLDKIENYILSFQNKMARINFKDFDKIYNLNIIQIFSITFVYCNPSCYTKELTRTIRKYAKNTINDSEIDEILKPVINRDKRRSEIKPEIYEVFKKVVLYPSLIQVLLYDRENINVDEIQREFSEKDAY